MAKEDPTVDDLKDMARKIWLAGLGAYGKAFSEGREMFRKASAQSSDVFDDLVKRGEELEGEVDGKARAVMDDVKAQVSDLNLDERIAKMRTRIKREGKAAAKDMESRMEAVEEKIEELLRELKGGTKPKPAPKRTTTKTTTKKTPAKKAKAPAKKAPAKKTAAKTPAAKKTGTSKSSTKKTTTKKS